MSGRGTESLEELTGRVLWGANNIFSVRTDEGMVEARIKGKVLPGAQDEYNPLAPGDRVVVELHKETEQDSQGFGMIIRRLERTNQFDRWNKKRERPQVIAANIDELAIIASAVSPPFRPRFIDRAIALGEYNSLSMRIVINKCDQGLDPLMQERIEYYLSLGYPVNLISVQNLQGLDELRLAWSRKTVVLLGQSGVGKSSLLSRYIPDELIRTGEVSEKYNRGRHTTVLARAYPVDGDSWMVDTPGIRELDLYGIPPADLSFLYRDFARYASGCSIKGCMHVHEPGCAVKEAVEKGLIIEDRYDSYVNSLLVMEETARRTRDWKYRKL